MEPKDALKILSDATAQINTNRQTHQAMVEAVNVLLHAITQRPAPPMIVEPPKDKEPTVG